MTSIYLKPPLGAKPFHQMHEASDTCVLCGMSSEEITEKDELFCPKVLRANKAAAVRWFEVLREPN